jgi:hypothetical protein
MESSQRVGPNPAHRLLQLTKDPLTLWALRQDADGSGADFYSSAWGEGRACGLLLRGTLPTPAGYKKNDGRCIHPLSWCILLQRRS